MDDIAMFSVTGVTRVGGDVLECAGQLFGIWFAVFPTSGAPMEINKIV